MLDTLDELRTRFVIEGGRSLTGAVSAPGAKNAALPIMAASILAAGEVVLHYVPRITDVDVMAAILESLGARVREHSGGTLVIDTSSLDSYCPPYALVSKLNASFDVTGALLARFNRAEVPQPGGCVLGPRAVDLHLAGFQRLGAAVSLEHGSVVAAGATLEGADVELGQPSVGATKNIMLAATRARGTTIIRNAAKEPEVADLAGFINAMGGCVRGQGTPTIRIDGVRKLHGCEYTIIPDRLVAGTYLLGAAITAGDVTVTGIDPGCLHALCRTLKTCGCELTTEGASVRARGVASFRPVDVSTGPYPGFPTDLQPPLVAYLSLAQGTSHVEESIFDARFVYVSELARMGADIKVSGRQAIVKGVEKLKDAVVEAPDIRAGGALVLAALAAQGTSEIGGLQYIDRGYEFFEERLASLGASIMRASVVAPVQPRTDMGDTMQMPKVVTPFSA
ncbi:MAG: UDP-N-acetylglucosamine 1-carboxyvinyltransferase [Candidatus Eremiobacteraeota bacterium]|nr:UDP-N-acetylglucosamine 1-carboxyvinyltransferase [Candidatus Eremiobacteraeota bacterium]MBC5828381.1 UDP-N-acetylglucosamine 1-carboxyvinyltransferase [Candidatus Eremiobacteraeota bacterium]